MDDKASGRSDNLYQMVPIREGPVMSPWSTRHMSQGTSQVMKYRHLQFPTGIAFILNYLIPDFLTVRTG